MPKRDGARAVGFDALVRQRYVKLSPAHRRIADYLLADGRRAALVPAADIAKTLDMSEATVSRFAQALGYDGYPQLRDRLRERFLVTATSLDRLAASAEQPRGSVLERARRRGPGGALAGGSARSGGSSAGPAGAGGRWFDWGR